MKGGRRYGAGRPSNRLKTWQVQRLNVYRMARAGRIEAGTRCLEVAYVFNLSGGKIDVRERILIVRQHCTYGGTRPMFTCPRCGRVCAVLYLNGWPGCVRCAKLGYQSQAEDAVGRSWMRTRRIEARLGWDDKCSGHGKRPKGMRRATFERLREAWWQECEVRDTAIERLFAGFMARRRVSF